MSGGIGNCDPGTRRQNGMTLLAVRLVGAALLLGACGSNAPQVVAIGGVEINEDGVLVVGFDTCQAEYEATVREELDEVGVTVRRTKDGHRTRECADGLRVPLTTLLGDRRLLDDSTGKEINVMRR